MIRLTVAVAALIAAGAVAAVPVMAQEGPACLTKAVGKDGKALVGVAKTSSIKKCCEAGAVGKDGKKLAGAAKKSFMTKCEAGS